MIGRSRPRSSSTGLTRSSHGLSLKLLNTGGEERLWQAVIYQALRDTLSYDRRVRDDALAFLHRQTVDLNMVCDMASVIPRKVLDAAKYLEELGPREGVVYLGQLFQNTRDEVTNHDQGNNQD